MKITEFKTIQLLSCRCGESIEVSMGSVGVSLQCDHCETIHRVESLANMKALPSRQVAVHEKQKTRFTFSVSALVRLTIICALICFVSTRVPVAAFLFFMGAIYLLVVASIVLVMRRFINLIHAVWDWFDER